MFGSYVGYIQPYFIWFIFIKIADPSGVNTITRETITLNIPPKKCGIQT